MHIKGFHAKSVELLQPQNNQKTPSSDFKHYRCLYEVDLHVLTKARYNKRKSRKQREARTHGTAKTHKTANQANRQKREDMEQKEHHKKEQRKHTEARGHGTEKRHNKRKQKGRTMEQRKQAEARRQGTEQTPQKGTKETDRREKAWSRNKEEQEGAIQCHIAAEGRKIINKTSTNNWMEQHLSKVK